MVLWYRDKVTFGRQCTIEKLFSYSVILLIRPKESVCSCVCCFWSEYNTIAETILYTASAKKLQLQIIPITQKTAFYKKNLYSSV